MGITMSPSSGIAASPAPMVGAGSGVSPVAAGVSFLPDFVTQDAVERGTVVRVDIPGFEPELWKQVVYHSDKWVSHQMKTVIEHLTNISVG